MKKTTLLAAGAALSLSLFLVSCQTSAKQVGTLAGAGAGAIAGAVAGNNIDGLDSKEGAIAGAVLGGLLGNISGRQQDQINSVRGEVQRNSERTVNVPNSNGSFTPVRLLQVPEGWQGPRGEVYASFPTEDQLMQAYGF